MPSANVCVYNINEIKSRLKITGNSNDDMITSAAETAVFTIQRLTGIPLPQRTFTEYYDGTASQKLVLNNRPVVRAGIQVVIDEGGGYGGNPDRYNTSNGAMSLNIGSDFDLKDNDPRPADPTNPFCWSGILLRLNALWPVRFRRSIDGIAWRPAAYEASVKVTYTAGLAAMDFGAFPVGAAAVIKNAIGMESAAQYRIMDGLGPTTSESLNGASFSIGQNPNIINSQQISGYGPAKMASPIAFALLAGAGLINRRVR